MKDWLSRVVNVLAAALAVFAVVLQIFPPQTSTDQQRSFLYLLLTLMLISAAYSTNFFWTRIQKYINSIRQHSVMIQKLQEQLNIERKFSQIDKRIAILEKLSSRRGDFNPAWLFLILLLIVFFFYLRSLGIV